MTEGNDASGAKILSEEDNGYCSLTSDGVYFYYYKLNDKHFYRYNTTTGEESDLMANFTVRLSCRFHRYACGHTSSE